MQFKNGDDRPIGVRLAQTGVSAALLGLGILIVGQLMPHHAPSHAGTSKTPADDDVATEQVVASTSPAPVAAAAPAPKAAVVVAPTAAPSPPKVAAVPLAANVISQVVANPDAFAPSHVFAPPAAPEQIFNFEPLPPFNSTTLKRARTNPSAWELDAMHGPKMNDLGPEGAVRQAAVARDSIGNETPWYSIDSGPLAPAYAVMQAGSVRVMSRAFMLANRADLPPEVASELDR